jgi:hypothetical protein
MHGGTVLLIAVFQNLTMGVQAGIFRQQRRVDIQQTTGEVFDKAGLRIRI